MTAPELAPPASSWPEGALPDAADLDRADPLARFHDRFVQSPDVTAYLDGNSLGRPLRASIDRVQSFMTNEWGSRLIRGWDEGWITLGQAIGDDLGRVVLGAAPGQSTIGDSTTVLIYKLVRAAVDARPGRTELVIDRDNFPTDRYILEGIAAERGLTVRWIDTDLDAGVTPERAAQVIGPNTALVVLSQVAYRSGFLADVPAITTIAHDAGALILWDLCHSAGVIPTELDAWGVDLAVGCTYKYLNGGPGSPAFAYVRTELQGELKQPIQGWLGSATPFEMGQGYVPAEGIRGFLSGTPPVIASLAMRDMIALIEEAGHDATTGAGAIAGAVATTGAGAIAGAVAVPGIEIVRAKSIALTEYAIALVDELLPDATLSSPRDATLRGAHITIDHPSYASIMSNLWAQGIIPDFRRPHGIRLGLSPLSTSFAEVRLGVEAVAAASAS
ncbi:MAG: kynureninase [Rhodoglobus sp.]